MEGILYDKLSYTLTGIFFNVQNTLGTKFQEKHYVKAVCALLDKEKISYQTEVPLQVQIQNTVIGNFRADLLVENKIIIEFKAVDRLTKDHKLQILRYLEALDLRLGILVNFRMRPLQYWRVPN